MNGRVSSACERARSLASAWIDGELRDRAELESHLGYCAECRAHVAELRELSHVLAPLRRSDTTPVDLWPAIAARIAQRSALPEPSSAPIAVAAERTRARHPWSLRVAAAVAGFAGTLALLRAALGSAGEAPAPATWASALHVHASDLGRLAVAPEQRLLALLDAAPEEQR